MEQTFPEEPILGDIFNGTLKGTRQTGFYVHELNADGWNSNVKTIMGWQDLPCLSYEDLVGGRRYKFELVSSTYDSVNSEQSLICRALSETLEQRLAYEHVPESKFREVPQYNVEDEVIIIPSNITCKKRELNPFLIFYDPLFEIHYFNERDCLC